MNVKVLPNDIFKFGGERVKERSVRRFDSKPMLYRSPGCFCLPMLSYANLFKRCKVCFICQIFRFMRVLFFWHAYLPFN